VVFGEGKMLSSGVRQTYRVRLADGTERRVRHGKNASTYITVAGKRIYVFFSPWNAAKGTVACQILRRQEG
jgi:hypothetical protein